MKRIYWLVLFWALWATIEIILLFVFSASLAVAAMIVTAWMGGVAWTLIMLEWQTLRRK